jgi:hypothetical protein
MARYSVGGRSAATTAAINVAAAQLWNPHTTKSIKVGEIWVRKSVATADNHILYPTVLRGVPGSTITPDVDNHFQRQYAPGSGALLDLGAFTTQPTIQIPRFLGAGAKGEAASGNVTLGAPVAPQTDDIWIATIHSSDQVAVTFTDWTQIYQGNGGGTTSRLSVWYFRYAGTTPNLIVTHAAGTSIVGGIAAYRGCKNTTTPVNILGAGGTGTDASIELATVSTTVAGCMLLALDGSAGAYPRSPLPAGFAAAFEDVGAGLQNEYNTVLGTPPGSAACHYKIQLAVGASGGFVDTQQASAPWASVLLALEPIAGASVTRPALARAALPATIGEGFTWKFSEPLEIGPGQGLAIFTPVAVILQPSDFTFIWDE